MLIISVCHVDNLKSKLCDIEKRKNEAEKVVKEKEKCVAKVGLFDGWGSGRGVRVGSKCVSGFGLDGS